MSIDKAVERLQFESRWRRAGNLTEEEIRELGNFEFETCPETIHAQLRRYYLKLKIQKPEEALRMQADMPKIDEEALTEEEVINLCHVLYKYMSGFLLYFKGQCFTKSNSPISDSTIRYV